MVWLEALNVNNQKKIFKCYSNSWSAKQTIPSNISYSKSEQIVYLLYVGFTAVHLRRKFEQKIKNNCFKWASLQTNHQTSQQAFTLCCVCAQQQNLLCFWGNTNMYKKSCSMTITSGSVMCVKSRLMMTGAAIEYPSCIIWSKYNILILHNWTKHNYYNNFITVRLSRFAQTVGDAVLKSNASKLSYAMIR